MIFMDEGMIVEKADTKEFFANPRSERTKLFLSQILQDKKIDILLTKFNKIMSELDI